MTPDIEKTIERADRHAHAPAVIKKAANNQDHDDLGEICSEIEKTVREESTDRDVGKHAGIACLYMVVDRLAELGERSETDEDGGGDPGA